MRGRPLTARQLRFVEEYRRDGKAGAAARRAGYAETYGWQLLRDARVLAALGGEAPEGSVPGSAQPGGSVPGGGRPGGSAPGGHAPGVEEDTPGRVIGELCRIAFAGPALREEAGRLAPGAPEDLAAVSQLRAKPVQRKDGSEAIEWDVRYYDKMRALELLGRHFGLFGEGAGGPAGEPLELVVEYAQAGAGASAGPGVAAVQAEAAATGGEVGAAVPGPRV